jgi:hypothetical protein
MAGNVGGLHIFANDVGPEALSLLDGNYGPLNVGLNNLNNFANYYVDSGAVNAAVVTIASQQTVTLSDGLMVEVQIANTTTTTTPSLNVNSTGAKTIVNPDGSALQAGQITAGSYCIFIYDAVLNNWLVVAGSRGLPGGFSANASGAWNFAAPSAGSTVTINGYANTSHEALQILCNFSAGNCQGLLINCGAGSTSDNAVYVTNGAGTAGFFNIIGDGEILMCTPPGAGGQGVSLGSNVGYQVGYMETIQNVQSASYTLVITDRGKWIQMNAGTVMTIPANASVAFPIGTTIIILNLTGASITIPITSDTLYWLPSFATGTRTLAYGGLATIYKRAATAWMIWGFSLS